MDAGEQRSLEGPDLLGQISQHLEADGLSPQCGEGEKLLYLWSLYQQLQTDLKKSRENEEKLKVAQTEEMREVENYVEHIRHLSDEREALIQELETENEQLKTDLDSVRAELAGSSQKEKMEILIKEGLGEIADALPGEQIAFLIKERSHLLKELAELRPQSSSDGTPNAMHSNSSQSKTADTQGQKDREFKELLEQERKDWEQELLQHRESASMMKDQLRKEHEEEIGALMDENSKLEEELQEAKRKALSLEKQLERLKQEQSEEEDILEEERDQIEGERDQALQEKKELAVRVAQLEKEKEELELSLSSLEKERDLWKMESAPSGTSTPPTQRRPSSPHRSQNDVALRKVIEDKTKIEADMIQLRGQIRILRNEKEAAEEEAEKCRKDMTKLQVNIQQLQVKNKNLRQEVDDLEVQLDDAESAADEAKKREEEAATKCKILQEEVKTLNAEIQRNATLQDIVDILSGEKSELSAKLENVRKELHKALAEKEDLLSQNARLGQEQMQLTSQLASLSKDLTNLQKERDEIHQERAELLNTRNTQEGILTSLQAELSASRNNREKLLTEAGHAEKEIGELKTQLAEAKTEVGILRHASQELAKQELIVAHLKEQNMGLANQLAELKSELEWARKTEQSLIDSQQTTQRAHTDSERRLTTEIDDLRLKLQHALLELQATKVAYEDQLTAKSTLTEQLSLTKTQLHQTAEEQKKVQQELRTKAELEQKVLELEKQLTETTRLADSYENECRQRLEMEAKFQQLNKEFEAQTAALQTQFEKEKELRSELEIKVQELEQSLDDARMEGDTMQSSLKAKTNSLEIRIQKLQDELFNSQDELAAMQQKYQQALLDAEEARSEMLKYQAQAMDRASQVANKFVNFEEMEESLSLTKKQLQEARNELNQANTRTASLEEQLAAIDAERKKSVTDYKSLSVQKQLDSNRLEEMESSLKSLKRDLAESISALAFTKSQLKDKQNLLDAVRHEMGSLNRELEYLRETTATDSEDKMQHRERLKTAEARVRQLELENAELTRRLSDVNNERERLTEKLDKEKMRHTDSHHQSARYVEQLEVDLNTAQKQIRTLREELQQRQTSAFRLEADNLGQTAKYETVVARLEAEVKELKQNHRRESDVMGDKMASAAAECRDAKQELLEKDQTIGELKNEISHRQVSSQKLEAQLASECKTRSDVENRNLGLEQEMTKVWSQVRMLMECNTNLEGSKKSLEEELERKTFRVRDLENQLSSKESVFQSSLREGQNRAESAEIQVRQLKEDLVITSSKASHLEKQLQQVQQSQLELSDKTQQLAAIRNQLEGEKLQRTLLEQTVAELKHQVSLLKQRESTLTIENKQLQHKITKLESQLDDAQRHSYSSSTMSESNRQSLMDQITSLQAEVKALQFELLTTSERRDIDLQRYEERKQRTRNKLLKAKESYSLERSKIIEHMSQMDDDLRLTRAALQKELEWKDKMDSSYKHLLEEKRHLISQLAELEEAVRDKGRNLAMLQVKVTYLEDENRHLQLRADTLTAQKQALDKLVKDFQQNREREALAQNDEEVRSEKSPTALAYIGGSYATVTSDLGNSSDVAWEQDQTDDGSLIFRYGTTTFNSPRATLHPPASSLSGPHDTSYYQSPGLLFRQGEHGLYRFQGQGRGEGQKVDMVRLYRDKLQRLEDREEGLVDDGEFEA